MKRLFGLIILAIIAVTIYLPNKNQIDTSVKRWIDFSFCDRPITYRIGYIDDKFDLSETDLRTYIEDATVIWENAVDKNLFEYDPKGTLEINMVYDERHEVLKEIYSLESDVDAEKQDLAQDSTKFEQDKEKLEKDLDKLNAEIDYWNDKGGAPKDVYEQLIEKQNELKKRVEQVNKMAQSINSTVDIINSEIHSLNSKVSYFNEVTKVKPEKGLYTSGIEKIEIFFYTNNDDLVHVMAHELGHAIGLDHVTDPSAIMNPIATDITEPTEQDITEITTLCENRNRLDIIKNDIRNYFYNFYSRTQTEVLK